ncbi:MAG: hypothetical protein V7L20_31680 [Nostoc sp.]
MSNHYNFRLDTQSPVPFTEYGFLDNNQIYKYLPQSDRYARW